MNDLTLKQERFVNHYLGDAAGNATESARLAGYKGSEETLNAVGYENLRKPHIRARAREVLEEEGVTPRYIIRRLKLVVDMDPEGFRTAGRESKATLADYVRGCELFMKSLGMQSEQLDINTTEHKRIEIISIEAVPTKPRQIDQ